MKNKNDEIYAIGFEQGYKAALASQSVKSFNKTAFIWGAIAGLFGIWGLSHVLNGKARIGCLLMIIVPAGLLVLVHVTNDLVPDLHDHIVVGEPGSIAIYTLGIILNYLQARNGATTYSILHE